MRQARKSGTETLQLAPLSGIEGHREILAFDRYFGPLGQVERIGSATNRIDGLTQIVVFGAEDIRGSVVTNG